MTKSKSIREYCLECCGGNSMEVRECPSKKCTLWRFRMTHEVANDVGERTPRAKAIRNKCLDCGEGTWLDAKNCPKTQCSLHEYRLG